MESSEVFGLGNDSFCEFHRPHLILLSLYEGSGISEAPAQESKVLTQTALGSNPSFGTQKRRDLIELAPMSLGIKWAV